MTFKPGELQAVMEVLGSAEQDWMTVSEIARHAHVPPAKVYNILESHPNRFIRSSNPDPETGEALYSTRDSYKDSRGFWGRLYDLSTSSST